MEWRRVQEERPSSSTSGGQSDGTADIGLMAFFAPMKSVNELHVRHLEKC